MLDRTHPHSPAKELASALQGSRCGDQFMAQCPAHDDAKASLSIGEEDGKVLLHCHAGCAQDAVLDALRRRDLWPERQESAGAPKARTIGATYDYTDEQGTILFQAVRYEPKDFRQRRPDFNGGWTWNLKGVRAVPYRLPELVEAIGTGHTVFIVEGEKDADNLAKLGIAATCNGGGAGKWKAEHSACLHGADVVIIPDNDEPGRKHAEKVANSLTGVAARVRVLALPDLPEKGDVSDWLASGAGNVAAQLWALADNAPEVRPSDAISSDKILAARRFVQDFINLPTLEKPKRQRLLFESTGAKHLFALAQSDSADDRALFELVKAYVPKRDHADLQAILKKIATRTRSSGGPAPVEGPELESSKAPVPVREPAAPAEEDFPGWKIEPWADPVDGAKLLDDLVATIERHMVLPDHAASTAALWVLHSWAIDCFEISPFLTISSPTKQCGKTTLLILLNYLTPRPIMASNISPAAIFRFIEQERPTLLIDEADTFARDNEELRGILNSGHTRPTACVVRVEGEGKDRKAKRFSTWAPKIIAAIGSLPPTVMDRSVIVMMRRKRKTERAERLRFRDADHFVALRRRSLRWFTDNAPALRHADPIVPEEIDNRPADNWRPLLAVADLVGGNWPKRARDAAKGLSGGGGDSERGIELLGDIRRIFRADKVERFGAEALVTRLIALEDAPWAEYRKPNDRPISSRGVAMLLKDFGIASVKVRGPAEYHRAHFEEAWESYLPPIPPI